jgi:glyoxylase-like metal-dependent hydrolase (beta-lactamase superfamily II)
MRVHHINCGTMCPYGGHLMDGVTPGLGPARFTCHCLLVETDRGLVLVDTGFGMDDVRAPVPRLSRFFLRLDRIRLEPEETALRQVERRGFSARDVRHIVLTHLDFDHAGGLTDFPEATVHLLAAEAETASDRRTPLLRGRYRPPQWGDTTRWRRYRAGGEPWFGFDCVRDLEGLPPDILLVPLVGHTLGHSGVAVRTDGRWLLHAGDAYFLQSELNPERPKCPSGTRIYQTMMERDRRARLENQERLRRLIRERAAEVDIIPSHDPTVFDACAARNPPATGTSGAVGVAGSAPA